jgi:hypothetical protein
MLIYNILTKTEDAAYKHFELAFTSEKETFLKIILSRVIFNFPRANFLYMFIFEHDSLDCSKRRELAHTPN